jgi:hypothetical protein
MSDTATLSRLGMVLMNADAPRTSAAPVPAPGVHSGVSHQLYHRWAAASNSRLSKLQQSPAHLRVYMDEPTDARHLAMGRAAHNAILEPGKFDGSYVVSAQCTAIKKDKDRCSNSGIVLANGEWFCGVHGKGISSDAGAVTVLPQKDYDDTLRMRDAVMAHPKARRLLSGVGDAELSVVWTDAGNGVLCKARLDRWSPAIAGGAIVDIKTCRDASPRVFERSIYEYGYHRQAAMYLAGANANGLSAEHFVVVAVEKEPPFAVAVYRITEGAIDAGADQVFGPMQADGIRRGGLLGLYGRCLTTDTWPGYSDNIEDIALPHYAWGQISDEAAATA